MSVTAKLNSIFERGDAQAHAEFLAAQIRGGLSLMQQAQKMACPDDWLEWALAGLSVYTRRRSGWVYVAANPTLRAPVVKVGQTRLEPQARMRSLRTAGVLGEFVLLHAQWVPDRHYLESEVHRQLRTLAKYDRELFLVPASLAIELVQNRAQAELARFSLVAAIPDAVSPAQAQL